MWVHYHLHRTSRVAGRCPSVWKLFNHGGSGLALQTTVWDRQSMFFRSKTAQAGVWIRHPGGTNESQFTETVPTREKSMLTGDLNAAEVEWIVQYRISDPELFLLR